MHVLIQSTWYSPVGGAEIFALNLAKHLNSDIRVTFSVCFVGPKVPLEINRPNVEIIDVTDLNDFARGYIRSNKPDVVHVNNADYHGFLSATCGSNCGAKIVCTNHSISVGRNGVKRRIFTYGRKTLQKWLNILSDASVAPSRIAAVILNERGVKRPVLPISCGVDTHLFVPGDQAGARRRLELEGKPIILFVGRIVESKGLVQLLTASSDLKFRRKRPHLVVMVGPSVKTRGGYICDVTETAAEYGLSDSVLEIGYVPHGSGRHRDLYTASDVFCMPSLFETLNLGTLEAMSSGRPVVSSDAGALPELVQDGVNGILYPSGDEERLADALEEILTYPQIGVRMGQKGREKALEHDLAITARKYEELYRSLVSGQAPTHSH